MHMNFIAYSLVSLVFSIPSHTICIVKGGGGGGGENYTMNRLPFKLNTVPVDSIILRVLCVSGV